ncbi:MAG: PAS domain-containing sensor histidine kinase [Myxococcaceae bacterium]|nr:PAS domain-containing sensor histidine kinase [Myxococcaceae bacterium]
MAPKTTALEAQGAMAPAMPRARVLGLAVTLFAAVVGLEWISHLDYSLGVLYVFPVAVAALVLTRVEVVIAAIVSAAVRSQFTAGLSPVEFSLRFVMAVLAYCGIGLLVGEISRHRRVMSATVRRLELEQAMRQQAEEQLRMLADSSPAAIIILNSRAEVVVANRAAHDMLGYENAGELVGVNITPSVPMFAHALEVTGAPSMRTSATGWATRKGGERFPVATWFSTYGGEDDRRLAGIVVDASDEVRDRERENFRHVYSNNRLFASAVSHEIRNLCSAIKVVTSNLQRHSSPDEPDLMALGKLVESLARLASFELTKRRGASGPLQLGEVLGQLRLVITPDWDDLDGEVTWDVPEALPLVHADEHALLQVFLNLAQNSARAVQEGGERRLLVKARADGGEMRVSFEDQGPGLKNPETLFQPFREGSAGSGLGLFISRNIIRSLGGELRHVATESGCRFDVTLPAAGPSA